MLAYRQIQPDDFAALAQLSPAMAAIVSTLEPEEWKPAGTGTGWVACEHETPIAAALACRRAGALISLEVHPQFRGQGIGSELLRQAEAWLFSHGWAAITADATDVPENFLLKHGWRINESSDDGRLFKANAEPVFSLEEHWVEDPASGYGRLIRLRRAATSQAHPLCLILDGETYWRDMAAAPIFDDVAAALAAGMTVAYVGHVSALARHQDFTTNENYACFIGETVVPWLQQQISGLEPGKHMVVGLSLSGLMAVHLAVRYPQHFRACLSQSGSHWWDPEGFMETVKRHSPVQGHFWLSVGDRETATDLRHPPTGLHQTVSQIEGVRNAAEILRQFGATVHYHEFAGGHSGQCWLEELKEALGWCLRS